MCAMHCRHLDASAQTHRNWPTRGRKVSRKGRFEFGSFNEEIMAGPRGAIGLEIALVALSLSGLWAAAPVIASDTLVSIGSPMPPFSQNKQNEPALAVDANSPFV